MVRWGVIGGVLRGSQEIIDLTLHPQQYGERLAADGRAQQAEIDAMFDEIGNKVAYRMAEKRLCVMALGIMRAHPDGPPDAELRRLEGIGSILRDSPDLPAVTASLPLEDLYTLSVFLAATSDQPSSLLILDPPH